MNRKLAIALFALPFGLSASLAKSALAAYPPNEQESVVVAQRYDDRWNNDPRYDDQRNRDQQYNDQRNRDRQEAIRRDELRRERFRRDELRRDELRRDNFQRDQNRRDDSRWNQNRWNQNRQNDQRVWIPSHYEPGFLGIGRRWVEGHWENR